VVRSAEKPAGEAERECTPEGRGGCLKSGGLYNTELEGVCDTLRYESLARLLLAVTTAWEIQISSVWNFMYAAEISSTIKFNGANPQL